MPKAVEGKGGAPGGSSETGSGVGSYANDGEPPVKPKGPPPGRQGSAGRAVLHRVGIS